ncbi:MAG: membrane dipeptidase [Thermomicrobiales bacterium]
MPDDAAVTLHHDAFYLDAAVPLVNARLLPRYLPDLQAGGVDAILTTVASLEDCHYAVTALAGWRALAASDTLPFRLCATVAEFRAAKRDGVLAVGLHFQGGNPLEGNLDLIDAYHALGVRVMQLTYNARNAIGDGCLEDANAGLSTFGRKVVRRLDERRVVIDISHVGERSSLEALSLASGPVVATHANARGVHDSARNLSDEQIRAVAASGGVIGLCGFPAFIAPDDPPTLDQLIDHAVYIADLVGAEHLGLGLDFAIEDEDDYDYFGYDPRYYPRPPWTWPTGLGGFFRDAPNITTALRRRGFSESETRGILGENFLRVFARVWGE